jgi:inner membrane protein
VPSVFTHAIAGAALGACCARPPVRWSLVALGAACAVLPDLDVAGLAIGFHLDHPLGHRGLSHSLPFAALVASALAAVVPARWRREAGPWRVWLVLFAGMASHGLLDALTNGGRGVAFLAPFSDTRWHFPFTPIEVSPISVRAFFTSRGLAILASELLWVWVPAALLVLIVRTLRRGLPPGEPSALGERIQTP